MTPAEGVLHREKLSYPRSSFWFMTFTNLAMGASMIDLAAQTGDMVEVGIAVTMTVLMMALWFMMATLRITVSRSVVSIQYGLFGPKIPLDQIELVGTEDEFSTWYGILYSMKERAWLYNMMGGEGQAVRIHYRNKRGARKKLLVSSKNHHLLADKINQARSATVVTDADVDLDVGYFSDVADAAANEEDVRVEEVEQAQVER